MSWQSRDIELMERGFEKDELAAEIRAALVMLKIRIMAFEIFPAHRPNLKEIL